MRFKQVAVLATLTTACVIAVSACDSESPQGTTIGGDETTSPSPSASATPSSTPTSTAVDTEETRFLEDFVAALNTMTTSGESAPFLDMCTSKSQSCTVAAKSVTDIYKAGGSFVESPSYQITEWALAPTGEKPVKLQAYMKWNAYEYIPAKGAKPKAAEAGNTLYEFQLVREGSTWKVQEYFVP